MIGAHYFNANDDEKNNAFALLMTLEEDKRILFYIFNEWKKLVTVKMNVSYCTQRENKDTFKRKGFFLITLSQIHHKKSLILQYNTASLDASL